MISGLLPRVWFPALLAPLVIHVRWLHQLTLNNNFDINLCMVKRYQNELNEHESVKQTGVKPGSKTNLTLNIHENLVSP